MPGPSMLIPLPTRPPCSPYCDHSQGAVAVAPHPVPVGGNTTYDYTCPKCGKTWEYEVVPEKWHELDANGKRVV